jgi:DNA-binding MarR family transcriptional regulator
MWLDAQNCERTVKLFDCRHDKLASQRRSELRNLTEVCKHNNTYTYHLDATFNLNSDTRPQGPAPATASPEGHLPIDAPERRRLPPLLRRAWYGLNQAFRRRIAHLDLTPDQFTVMRTLLENDPKGLTQRALTQLMSSDPNTVASLLERMESAGLLQRKPHETDRRAHRIRLQPAGKRKYLQAREIAIALQGEILSVLPEDKREEFLHDLGLVADQCRAAAHARPEGPARK